MAIVPITIERHIIENQREFPKATGEFSALLYDIAFATKLISRAVNQAGLVDILGSAEKENVQGETVQKLDEYAHRVIYRSMAYTGRLCCMASEEVEEIISIPENYKRGKYVLLFDPLDGSSNIEANVSIGTIFSIYRKVSPGPEGTLEDCLQPGRSQVAAGYVLYGSSTILVYTAGNGVHGFTLDPSIGEFLLSHEQIETPRRGNVYSCNEGNLFKWDTSIQDYIEYIKTPDKESGRPYKSRYVGSLVADFHRNLLYGGIFLYPAEKSKPRGKLRLLYEANPLSMLVEQAGGLSTDGESAILDQQPEQLHQRTPLIIGSHEDVKEVDSFIKGLRAK